MSREHFLAKTANLDPIFRMSAINITSFIKSQKDSLWHEEKATTDKKYDAQSECVQDMQIMVVDDDTSKESLDSRAPVTKLINMAVGSAVNQSISPSSQSSNCCISCFNWKTKVYEAATKRSTNLRREALTLEVKKRSTPLRRDLGHPTDPACSFQPQSGDSHCDEQQHVRDEQPQVARATREAEVDLTVAEAKEGHEVQPHHARADLAVDLHHGADTVYNQRLAHIWHQLITQPGPEEGGQEHIPNQGRRTPGQGDTDMGKVHLSIWTCVGKVRAITPSSGMTDTGINNTGMYDSPSEGSEQHETMKEDLAEWPGVSTRNILTCPATLDREEVMLPKEDHGLPADHAKTKYPASPHYYLQVQIPTGCVTKDTAYLGLGPTHCEINTTTAQLGMELSWQEMFRDTKCIEEPTVGKWTQYISSTELLPCTAHITSGINKASRDFTSLAKKSTSSKNRGAQSGLKSGDTDGTLITHQDSLAYTSLYNNTTLFCT